MEQAILRVLARDRGRVLTAEELHTALPIKLSEKDVFRKAYNNLSKQGKIKTYIGLP